MKENIEPMTGLLQNLQTIIRDSSVDENYILQRLKNLVLEYEPLGHPINDSKSLAELYAENLAGLQDENVTNNVIKTGFANLDQVIGGFSPGELVVIGGRPAMGKTQLCVNLALHIAQKHPVLYFTFDLSEYLLTNRFISAITGIAVNKLIQHDLTFEEKKSLAILSDSIHNPGIFLNDSGHHSVSALKTQCKKQIRENGIQVIIVDYLQMMGSDRYRNSRELEVSYISRELKSIAGDHDVCLIVTSQLSRSPERRSMAAKPLLSDLRDSGAIEQDADKVIFIYRPEYYSIDVDEVGNSTEGLTELIIAKNRNGRLGTACLKRNAAFTSFSDFTEHQNEFIFSQDRMDEIEKSER